MSARVPDLLWRMENRFWLDGPEFYKANMAAEAVMVFAGVGVMQGEAILDGLRQAPRWNEVEMDGQASAALGETSVLSYRATARREGEEPYRAVCSSTYVRRGDDHVLLAHHQSPER